jgi:peptide-methionine (R)-S-oxide reductase
MMTRRFAMMIPMAAWAAKGPKMVKIMGFDDTGRPTGVAEVEKIEKPDAEWKAQLPPDTYMVARKKGTERAFANKYDKNKADGLYKCACCYTVLFDSKAKFDSGTGWPSFWAPIAKENVKTEKDFAFGMMRDEVVCARCEGHLGHVFEDGPRPTGLRYCMNSAAMLFVDRAK